MTGAPGISESAVGRPPAHLASLVSQTVGYRYQGFPPGTHLGLPSPHLAVVVSLGAPVRLAALPDPGDPPGVFAALASGLDVRPAVIAHDGDEYGLQLDLTPEGARSLLGVPAGALRTTVSLDELLGPVAHDLPDRLAALATWPARFAALDAVLSHRTGRLAPVPAPLARAWRLIVGSGGAARIAEVAAEVGWSRRHLAERFTREYGLSPKQAARVARFARSRRLLQRGNSTALAAVAAACGYADQAHMAREWNALAGCAPSAWRAAEQLPFVQDGDAEAEARSAA